MYICAMVAAATIAATAAPARAAETNEQVGELVSGWLLLATSRGSVAEEAGQRRDVGLVAAAARSILIRRIDLKGIAPGGRAWRSLVFAERGKWPR